MRSLFTRHCTRRNFVSQDCREVQRPMTRHASTSEPFIQKPFSQDPKVWNTPPVWRSSSGFRVPTNQLFCACCSCVGTSSASFSSSCCVICSKKLPTLATGCRAAVGSAGPAVLVASDAPGAGRAGAELPTAPPPPAPRAGGGGAGRRVRDDRADVGMAVPAAPRGGGGDAGGGGRASGVPCKGAPAEGGTPAPAVPLPLSTAHASDPRDATGNPRRAKPCSARGSQRRMASNGGGG
mmetsp:Transcript_41870/g.125138  ORF Transcript_41870/g.125138 Transcript_41870/m.125138 type:complete len:237 (-) Transcript_41870:23-733(-)